MRAAPFVLLLPLLLPACADLAEMGIGTTNYPVTAHGDWGVFADDTTTGRRCWAATHPGSDTGPRRDAFVMVTTAPELSAILPGLPDGEGLALAVGTKSWPMFAKGGEAWLKNGADERPAVQALEAAAVSTAKIKGIDGADVAEFYTNGLTAARTAAGKLCGL